MLAFVRSSGYIYVAKQPHEQKESIGDAILRMGF